MCCNAASKHGLSAWSKHGLSGFSYYVNLQHSFIGDDSSSFIMGLTYIIAFINTFPSTAVYYHGQMSWNFNDQLEII